MANGRPPFRGACLHNSSFAVLTLPSPKDPRRAYHDFRKHCYEHIFKVIVAVDKLAASDPGVIDGQTTLISKRQNEAYEVISGSKDDVFLTSLYDWYLEHGWSDRLLNSTSPFVVTYLERKSEVDISHADLLWRYYGQSHRYSEAAKVQYQLAQSAFALPLARRIEYLGKARSNASTFTPDISRQARQRLLQEIATLIDVANIQDELLQRLKEDTRLDPDRKAAIMKDIDGPILDISLVSFRTPPFLECVLTCPSFSINTPIQAVITTYAYRFFTLRIIETLLISG